jgi:hypothetical protein
VTGYIALGILIAAAYVTVAIALAYGIGYSIHQADHCDDYNTVVDTALAAVADVEDADVRLWELENGWATP